MLKLTSQTRTFDVEINGEVVSYPINTSVSNALRCIESAKRAQKQVVKLQKAATDMSGEVPELIAMLEELLNVFVPLIDAMLGDGTAYDVCERLGLAPVDAIEQVMALWEAVAAEAAQIAGAGKGAKAAHYLDA